MAENQSHGFDGSEQRAQQAIARVGELLNIAISALIVAVPGAPRGPVELGRCLGVDKVLASRVLKAIRSEDPLAIVYVMPGPEPLRRLLNGAAERKLDSTIIERAAQAVDKFELLIRKEAGDRSSLNAIISAWVPEARKQFETSRKQAAFKAMSQLKGACTDLSLATVAMHPSSDGHHVDFAWVIGSFGLQRLRPGAAVKFTSRRIATDNRPRQPVTLDGEPVEGLEGLRLDKYCSEPPAKLDVQRVGERIHYILADDAFGPNSAADLVFAEVNMSEVPRIVPDHRKGYVFTEVNTPAKTLLFDVFIHRDLHDGRDEPELLIYDTVFDGVASVNDPSRTIDQLDLDESIECMGGGLTKIRAPGVPAYKDLVADVFDTVGWSSERFHGYRCRIEYPIYGSQVAMAFDSSKRRAN